ncbi:MAG: hypothetical protein Q7Q71_14865 [Verrucomicrobiota bacterium JB023]|nr:hypothetical protein [Verrucomicrobiota bacterium JB023]
MAEIPDTVCKQPEIGAAYQFVKRYRIFSFISVIFLVRLNILKLGSTRSGYWLFAAAAALLLLPLLWKPQEVDASDETGFLEEDEDLLISDYEVDNELEAN